jgi:hypothetical protein
MSRIRLTSELRTRCRDQIAAVLAAHGLEAPLFRGTDGRAWLSGQFEYHGRTHVINIDDDNVVMLVGTQLFECYQSSEFESADSLISSFTERLARYLDGGAWAGPDEKGLREALIGVLRRMIGK